MVRTEFFLLGDTALDIDRCFRDQRCFDHQEALWEYLETNEADLIVTDMHYPLAKGEKENEEAGFILLEKMKQREHPIPVIICSSQNYRSPDALGTVWYNKLRDIEFDFKEILENTNWDQFQR